MSTSIKVFAEHFQDGKWFPIYNVDDKEANRRSYSSLREVISLGQDYPLFAVLAGVRKERFEKWYRSKIKPISSPRGLPKDVSGGIKSYFKDAYSFSLSWYLVQEIVDFAWTKHTITKWGYVDAKFSSLFPGYDSFPYENLPKEAEIYPIEFVPQELEVVEVSWLENYKEFICSEYADMYDIELRNKT